MAVKEQLHKIIDQIEDEAVLNAYMQLLQSFSEGEYGQLFNNLSKDQKAQLEVSYQRSLNPSNLITHEKAMNTLSKWL